MTFGMLRQRPTGTRRSFAGLGFRTPLVMAFVAGLSDERTDLRVVRAPRDPHLRKEQRT
jgi:hypothetical protein